MIIAFNTVSVAAVLPSGNKKPDALSVDVVHGIVAGETIPIHAFSDGILLKNITLTSSDPSVISCSPDGHITGEKAGESADITCTSQDGSSKTFTVYCVKAVYPQEECTTNSLYNQIYAQPKSGKILSMHVNPDELGRIIRYAFYLLAFALSIIKFNPINSPDALQVFTFGNFKVYGQYGNFAYIRFDDTPSSDGFISYSKLSKRFDEFLYISDSSHTVKVGEQDEYLTADYYGNVTWEVENDKADDGTLDYENSIIDFDPGTGKIKAKKGGITSIRATANGMGRTCDIVSIYMWPQEWKVTAEKKITLYERPDIVDINYEINEGDTFWVVGDLGGSNSWCYINRGSQAFPEYSYAKIEDFSTKGTISQYNEMTTNLDGEEVPVRWPMYDESISFISSPYGPRTKSNGGNHKGFDITTGSSGKIEGCPIVATFSGTIKKIYIDNNKSTTHGNAIAITTDRLDPVTGKNLTIIYMHLSKWNTTSSGNIIVEGKVLKEGNSVTVSQVIGSAGNTGSNTSGAHLHYEINNQNAAIRNGDNNPFTETINPIFFYMDKSITKSTICEAASNGNGFYWYGENE